MRTLVPLPSSITPEAAAELLAMFATLSPADQNRVRDWMAELNAQGRGARR
ncbi:hypothetical protein [Rubripirellula obstinata]|uniref:hypothetical protein n=1 Tax=Rubripirellula obstinata TaxID=406547 RepID=UPI0012F958BF|nr:hypothetical protein [Rubripirellula obstinata]